MEWTECYTVAAQPSHKLHVSCITIDAHPQLHPQDQASSANYNHRAINDVEASIKAMAWVRKHLLVQPTVVEQE